MELTVSAVSTQRRGEIFGNRQRFATFLRIQKTLSMYRSLKQKLPFLETKEGVAIWFGSSVKKLLTTFGSDTEFATYLKENSNEFSLGLLLVDRQGAPIPVNEQRWVLFINGQQQEAVATISWDATEGGEKVGTVGE